MFKSKPNKDLLKKYPKDLTKGYSLPFGNKWRTKIAKEDIAVFEKYQKRIRAWYFSVIIPYALFYLIEYFRV